MPIRISDITTAAELATLLSSNTLFYDDELVSLNDELVIL